MRIGLMVGSDKERPRADRLAGLVADGRGAEAQGCRSGYRRCPDTSMP